MSETGQPPIERAAAAPRALCGIHAVAARLRVAPDADGELWLDEGRAARREPRLAALEALARAQGVVVRFVPPQALEARVAGIPHQGAVLIASPERTLHETHLETLLDRLASAGRAPFLLVLDGVSDPRNLGACLRVADAAGVHAVIAPRDRAAGLTAAACKAAGGAAERLPLIRVANLARTLQRLHERGVWSVGAAVEADESLFEIDLRGPLVFALGAEQNGLRRLTKARCGRLARIPMADAANSLNVSVAAGVCLFEAVRQRGDAR